MKKIKKCKVCGSDVAKSAKTCPNCGAKLKKSPVRIVIGIVLLVIGLSVVFSPGSDAPEEIEYTKYNISELMADLNDNPAKALDKYEGEYVELTGMVSVIDSDCKYISIAESEWDIIDCHCTTTNDEQKEYIKTLSSDSTITVRGKITDVGEVLGYWLDITEFCED